MDDEDIAPLRQWLSEPLVLSELRKRDPLVNGHAVKPRSSDAWTAFTPHSAAHRLVVEYDGRSICRADLAHHAAEALEQQTEDAWVRAYMACQLWGVGTTGRMHWTGRTLADPEAPARFAELAASVVDGTPERAAGRWADGWNESFTTKFAYAVGKALNDRAPTALVYDDLRVKEQLRRIGWGFPASGAGRISWRRYRGYLDAIHQEAERLNCRPDAIEWLLFDPEPLP